MTIFGVVVMLLVCLVSVTSVTDIEQSENLGVTVITDDDTADLTSHSISSLAISYDLADDPKMVDLFKQLYTAAGMNNCGDNTKCWCPSPGNVCYGGTYTGKNL